MVESTASSAIHKTWVSEQIRTPWHVLSVIIFASLSLMHPLAILGVLLLISIGVAISKIPSLVVVGAIVTIVSLIFPPLGALLCIIFFILKIKYLIQHFRPLIMGLLLIVYLFGVSFLYPYPSIGVFVLSAVLLHVLLVSLYKREYSSAEAVQIMASVPLYILIIILPIILQQFDEMDDLFEGNDYNQHVAQNERALHPEELRTGFEEDPDVHWVKSHLRKNSDGSSTVVSGHIRSNPDGFKGNNLEL